MTEENMEKPQVETETTAEQIQEKTFTQSEIDKIVADRLARQERKFQKQVGDIDLDQARQVLREREEAELNLKKERGEFEEILKTTVSKKDQEINALQSRLQHTLVDGELMNASAKHNAVSPDQVSTLLKRNIRLSEDGTVEVTDNKGVVRYNDKGELLTVDQAVSEFLNANPHFVRAQSGGSGTLGNSGGSVKKQMTHQDMVDNWNNGGKEAYVKSMKAT